MLATLLLPVVVVSMDLTVLYLAVPLISEQLRPSGSKLLWIMDIYGFVLAALLLPAGRLGDRSGQRRTLVLGAVLFGIASLAAALGPIVAGSLLEVLPWGLVFVINVPVVVILLLGLRLWARDPTRRSSARRYRIGSAADGS